MPLLVSPSKYWIRVVALLASWAAALLLLAGLSMPLLELQKFWIFRNSVSMLGGIRTLLEEGELWLGLVIAVFAIVFPLAKLAVMLGLLHGLAVLQAHRARVMRWLGLLGKWSMLDVFIVAILVTSVKLGGIASAHTGPGLYCFLGSVLLAQSVSLLLDHTYEPERQ